MRRSEYTEGIAFMFADVAGGPSVDADSGSCARKMDRLRRKSSKTRGGNPHINNYVSRPAPDGYGFKNVRWDCHTVQDWSLGIWSLESGVWNLVSNWGK